MEWIISNWSLVVVIVAAAVIVFFYVKNLLNKQTDEQIKAVKEWLLWAVLEAEKEFGGKTGKLKLRKVYDMFVSRFCAVAKLITFAEFSVIVDEVLIEARKLLETNAAIKQFVG